MLGKKKKVFVLLGMVSLLVATGFLHVFLNGNPQAAPGDADVDYSSSFAAYRADREKTRDNTMLYLNAIINDESSSEEARANAEASKLALTQNMELELTLESLIRAIGFTDVFVTNSTENINIIIKQEVLTDDEANRVLDVIVRETDREATSVIIIPVK